MGAERSKIFDIFCRLTYEDLIDPKAEIVKLKAKKAGKTPNSSIYSKKGFGMKHSHLSSSKNMLKSKNMDYVENKNPSTVTGAFNQSSQRMDASRISSSKGFTHSRNDSKAMSANNTSKDFSQFLKTEDEKSSLNIDVNKTYKTILASDPADRLKPKKKAGGKDGNETNKLNFDDYAKGKVKEYHPETVYLPKDQAFVHIAVQRESKVKREKQVAAFMNNLQRDMEERKLKERREDLKKKINQKIPKKIQPEDFLVKTFI